MNNSIHRKDYLETTSIFKRKNINDIVRETCKEVMQEQEKSLYYPKDLLLLIKSKYADTWITEDLIRMAVAFECDTDLKYCGLRVCEGEYRDMPLVGLYQSESEQEDSEDE